MTNKDVSSALRSVITDLNYSDEPSLDELLDEGAIGNFFKGIGRKIGNGAGVTSQAATTAKQNAGNFLETDAGIKRQGILLINDKGEYLGVRGIPDNSPEANDIKRMYQAKGFTEVTDQQREQAIQKNVKIQVVAADSKENAANIKPKVLELVSQLVAAAQKFQSTIKSANAITVTSVNQDPNFHAVYTIGKQIVDYVEQVQSSSAPAAANSVPGKAANFTMGGSAPASTSASTTAPLGAGSTVQASSGGLGGSAPTEVAPTGTAGSGGTAASINPAPLSSPGGASTTFNAPAGPAPTPAPGAYAPGKAADFSMGSPSASSAPAPNSLYPQEPVAMPPSITAPNTDPAPIDPNNYLHGDQTAINPAAGNVAGSTAYSGNGNDLGYQGPNTNPSARAKFQSMTPEQQAAHTPKGRINPLSAESVDHSNENLLTESVDLEQLSPLDIF